MKKITFIIMIMLFIASFALCFGAGNIYKGTKSEIDASASDDGYVKIKYLKETTKKLKVIIEKDKGKYTYDLNNKGEYDTYPLQMGDGKYKIRVFENIGGNRYATKQTVTITVKLKDENAPFLAPNQLVNFADTSETIKKAAELTEDKTDDFEKIDVIYDYIITNIKYDTEKANTVKSGYLPSIDEILKTNKGICFDYASMMASMLRSQDIPAKLVTGYSSKLNVFHAWNEVYTEETGWIKLNEMYFDGFQWRLMDSTIASSGKQSNSPKVMEYTNKLIDSKYYTKQFEY
ncbi:MAG: transglutaminase-like domain-containing protein [Tissierellia bacterium]|nr:transglutaminase-like domain-containing protein [Tissierellia bacterium]